MDKKELKTILKKHKLWLDGKDGGIIADLNGADLSGADLNGADLYGANLRGVDLYEANLSRANLYGADLRGVDLSETNLSGANLSEANLSEANLYGANLRGADLRKIIANKPLITFLTCKWWITYNPYNDKPVKIGCKENTIEEWDKWFKSDEEFETKRGTKEFKLIELSYKHLKKIIKEMT